jgi:hypothetical protein
LKFVDHHRGNPQLANQNIGERLESVIYIHSGKYFPVLQILAALLGAVDQYEGCGDTPKHIDL